MDMTKEQRTELRDIKRRLKTAAGQLSRTLSRCRRDRRVSERAYSKTVNAAIRLRKTARREIERDERIEAKHHDKVVKKLLARKAVLEGRLAS